MCLYPPREDCGGFGLMRLFGPLVVFQSLDGLEELPCWLWVLPWVSTWHDNPSSLMDRPDDGRCGRGITHHCLFDRSHRSSRGLLARRLSDVEQSCLGAEIGLFPFGK